MKFEDVTLLAIAVISSFKTCWSDYLKESHASTMMDLEMGASCKKAGGTMLQLTTRDEQGYTHTRERCVPADEARRMDSTDRAFQRWKDSLKLVRK